MVNGVVDLCARPGDFYFQRGDAAVEFVDRQPVEILALELRQGILVAKWRTFVGVHVRQR